MKNKRGQYYLIAGIVVVGLIMTFATVTNSIQKRAEKERMYTLYNSANFDPNKVANYEIGGENPNAYDDIHLAVLLYDMNNLFQAVDKDIYLVTVPLEGAEKGFFYDKTTSSENPYGNIELEDIVTGRDEQKISATINSGTYYFDYDNTQDNYFIIIIESAGEQYAVSGKG